MLKSISASNAGETARKWTSSHQHTGPSGPIPSADGCSADVRTVPEGRPRIIALVANHAELDMLSRQIPEDEFELRGFVDAREALAAVQIMEVDVVMADEDCGDGSGLDWLMEVRQEDPQTSLVLIANQEHPLDLAVDAINRARVSKLLTKPWDVEELLDELTEAAGRYTHRTGRDRRMVLSELKVRRLEQDYDEIYEKHTALTSRGGYRFSSRPAPRPTTESDTSLPTPSSNLNLVPVLSSLWNTMLAGSPNPARNRVIQLMDNCLSQMRWSTGECNDVMLATSLHHILLPQHAGETLVDVRGGSCKHATELAEQLTQVPGFEIVSEIIGNHHNREHVTNPKAKVSRGARLLQIVSLYDEIGNDQALMSGIAAENDRDYALTRASDIILKLAGKTVDYEIAQQLIKTVIPAVLKRSEEAVAVDQIRSGMVLSRTVYAENLILVPSGTELTERPIEKINSSAASGGVTDVWVAKEKKIALAS